MDKQSYLDWMKGSRRVHDLNILRQVIIDSSPWKIDTAKLDEALFERTYKLAPIPDRVVSPMLLNRALNYNRVMDEITTRMRPLKPEGKTLREQVQSLLPKKLRDSDVKEEDERRSLSYVFSRIVRERVPREKKWPAIMTGLDTLASAILSIFNISRIVNQQVPWLYSLWYYKVEQVKIRAIENILDALTGDGNWEDVTTEIEEADELINEALGQDPNLDSSIAQQDPLSLKIQELLREVESRSSNEKERRKKFRIKVSEELATLKGFGASLAEKIDVRSVSTTLFDVLAMRADGPAASDYENLLQLFRQEINILQYRPLIQLCLKLSKEEQPNRLTAMDLEQVTEFRGRKAYYELERLEHVLHERYFPTLRKIGLRYRYIFTPRQRPSVISDGMIERMILTEQNIRGCSIHIEPSWTKGPHTWTFPDGSYEAVVEDEIISMRPDAFNMKVGEWDIDASGSDSKSRKRSSRAIVQSTKSLDSRSFTLTERQSELLSILWRFEGSRMQRKWFLEQINFPIRTANRLLHQMLKDHILMLIHLPALEFCGLPDGLLIVANCFDRRSRDTLISQLTYRLPFVRVLFGDSNDVVAHARLPAKMSDQVGGTLGEMMQATSDSSFTARLKSSYTYRMTALQRIRNPETKGWKDPWPR